MSTRTYKTGTAQIVVDYGYDIHDIVFSRRTLDRIRAGKLVEVYGQGFRWCTEPDQDVWRFNGEEPGSLYVYTTGGGEIYHGHLEDGEVRVYVDGKDEELRFERSEP